MPESPKDFDKLREKRVEETLKKPVDRRSLLKGMAAVGIATGFSSSCQQSGMTFEKFFQKHYKEMTPKDKERVFARIKKEIKEEYGVDATISDPRPIPGIKFVYCLNLNKCIGTRKCVEACMAENNSDRSFSYIQILEMEKGGFDFEKSDRTYSGLVPKEGKYYLPVQCMQCENPPCVKVCPTEATWKESDGIVVVDYDWCIGCRYCQAACPYEARHFNFRKPEIPKDQINPNMSYEGNRIRPRGVVEKCHFCSQRTRVGKYPACLEACPTGARKFGNIYDPESEVSRIFKTKKPFVLKEELNTVPQFFYYFD